MSEMKMTLQAGPVDDLLTMMEHQARLGRNMLALARNSAAVAEQASPLVDATGMSIDGVAGRVGGVRTNLSAKEQAEQQASGQMQEAANAVARILQMAQALHGQVMG